MSRRQSRILVADDEATARLLLKAALEKAGYEVVVAADGEEALRSFRAEPADMVMLDVEMPGMNGYQVCDRLRFEAGDELPIVMVTGMDDMASIERAFEAGATDFIAKPINWALIGHRVRYLFRGCQVLQDLHAANRRHMAILDALRAVGLQLSLDDFGTGYSSLSYLKRLPLNNLKVDQSFVRGLPDDRESLAIVRAIVSLAKNLGFTVTAEGVETADHARVLGALDCETLQGYFIDKPMPAEHLPAALTRQWRREDLS